MFTFEIPSIDYLQLAPLIVVFLGGCVGVGIETFARRGKRSGIQVAFTAFVLILSLVFTILNWPAADWASARFARWPSMGRPTSSGRCCWS